jgi:N-acetylglutamate synthase-like GNAT family acetyltransferase
MIRKALVSDVQGIQILFQELTGSLISANDVLNRIQFVQQSTLDSLFVYEDQKIIAGLLAFRIRENIEENSRFGEISVLVVQPEFRKKGIGKELMEYAEHLAHEQSCIGTWLVSGFGREEKAHTFYKSLGYETTGYRFVKHFGKE